MIAVVTHVDRMDAGWALADQVNAKFIALDPGRFGAGHNHLRAWEWLSHNADEWSIVLEDDAQPVEGFLDQVDMALQVAPSPVVSLYLGQGRPQHWQGSIAIAMGRLAHEEDACWLMGTELLHHVGVAIKTSLLPLMIDNVKYALDEQIPIDFAIGAWVRKMGLKVAYSHPSLVNHDDQLPTLVHDLEEPRQRRRAWVCDTRDEWDLSSYDIPPLKQLEDGRFITAL